MWGSHVHQLHAWIIIELVSMALRGHHTQAVTSVLQVSAFTAVYFMLSLLYTVGWSSLKDGWKSIFQRASAHSLQLSTRCYWCYLHRMQSMVYVMVRCLLVGLSHRFLAVVMSGWFAAVCGCRQQISIHSCECQLPTSICCRCPHSAASVGFSVCWLPPSA